MSVHKSDRKAYFAHSKKNQAYHRRAKVYASRVAKLDATISKLESKLRNLMTSREVARDSYALSLRKAEEHRAIMAGYSYGG